jgi:hypothetical protein
LSAAPLELVFDGSHTHNIKKKKKKLKGRQLIIKKKKKANLAKVSATTQRSTES